MINNDRKFGGWRGVAAVAAAVAMLGVAPEPSRASDKHVKEAIIGGVVGVAIGAALSRKHQRNSVIYYPGYKPYYAPSGYDAYFAQSFSPSAGVMCYTAQRVCYNENGSVANKWSRRVFGY
jgi:surface antigen